MAERPPRPSVWSTIGIAVASAFVLGLPLGLLFAPQGDPASSMGRGFGQLLLPAVAIGWIWPYAVPRVSRWFVPLVVLVVGGALAVVVDAADPTTGNTNAHARLTETPVSSAAS